MNRREYQEILDRMDAKSPKKDHELRERQRFDFHQQDIPMRIDHPEGGSSHFLVYGRNISRSGAAVLHGGFVHAHSGCQLVLGQVDADPLAVQGEVRHCRLVAGSCHEIGVRFFEEIDPGRLIGTPGNSVQEIADSDGGFQTVSGTVMIAEAFPPDAAILEHHLSVLGVTTRLVTRPGSLMDTLKKETVDFIVYCLPIGRDEAAQTIGKIRAMSVDIPILVLTAETDADAHHAVRKAGATEVMPKPHNVDLLHAAVLMHLAPPPDPSKKRRPLYSTAAQQTGMEGLLKGYVETALHRAGLLEKALAAEDWNAVRTTCLELKGSGSTYGFRKLTVTAMRVLAALEADDVPLATAAIQSLVGSCKAIRLHAVPAAA